MDPRALEICLTNLALNAAKYAIEGSTIFYEMNQKERAVQIVIRNITTDKNADAFENWSNPYFSASKSSVGLGLHIVREVCSHLDLGFSQKIQRDGSKNWVSSKLTIPMGKE